MRRAALSRLPLILAAVVASFALGSCSTPAPGVACAWQVVSSPNPANIADQLNGVLAVSSDNIWTAGSFASTASRDNDRTLVEHWDGKTWSVVSSADVDIEPDGYPDSLREIAGSGPTDLWAIGTAIDSFLEHSNGSSWSIVNTAVQPASVYSYTFGGISARSPDDVWVVGTTWNKNNIPEDDLALTEHWDGTSWSIIPTPDLHADLNGTMLYAVAALAPDNVWAVGSTSSAQSQPALIEHWDGTAWSVVPSPQPQGTGVAGLRSLTALAPNDIWAGGFYYVPGGVHFLVEHWDGNAWSIVPTPVSKEQFPVLRQIAAVSDHDVWALSSEGALLHWDGRAWSVSTFPNAEQKGYAVQAMSVLPSGKVWLAGITNDPTGPGPRTLIATSCP